MRLAVMQPYFLPYMGYLQLIASVDRFVVLDDVNYRKGGYINRNRVWLGHHVGWLTLPVAKASPNRPILEHAIALDSRARDRLLRTVEQGYAKAPCREEGLTILDAALPTGGRSGLVETLLSGLDAAGAAFGMSTEWIQASGLGRVAAGLRGQRRILSICRHLGASEYVNLPGGRSLYDEAAFRDAGIRLTFTEPDLSPYPTGKRAFTPGLSVLDLIMHVAPPDRHRYLLDPTRGTPR